MQWMFTLKNLVNYELVKQKFSKIETIAYQQKFCCVKCREKWWGENYSRKIDHPNYEKHKENMRKYYNEVLSNDSSYVLLSKLRTRIRMAMKGRSRSIKTKELIGCSIENLKLHLQQTAIKNGYNDFDINNYDTGMYHIDHKVPCYAFDLFDEEQVKKCFHYTNLQILDAHENRVKNKKVA